MICRSSDSIMMEQEAPDISCVKTLKMTRQARPSKRQMRTESHAVRRLLRFWDNLHVKHSGLFYRNVTDDGDKYLPIPSKLERVQILQHLHDDMGHLGIEKTAQLVRDRHFWPGMYSETKAYIGRCKRCALKKLPDTRRQAPLQTIRTSRPLKLVCIDFLSLERCKGGFEHVMVVTDHYTMTRRWCVREISSQSWSLTKPPEVGASCETNGKKHLTSS